MDTTTYFLKVKSAKTRADYLKAINYIARKVIPPSVTIQNYDFLINNYDRVIDFLDQKSVDSIKRYTNIICMLLPSLSNFDEQIRRQYIRKYRQAASFCEKIINNKPEKRKKILGIFKILEENNNKGNTNTKKINLSTLPSSFKKKSSKYSPEKSMNNNNNNNNNTTNDSEMFENALDILRTMKQNQTERLSSASIGTSAQVLPSSEILKLNEILEQQLSELHNTTKDTSSSNKKSSGILSDYKIIMSKFMAKYMNNSDNMENIIFQAPHFIELLKNDPKGKQYIPAILFYIKLFKLPDRELAQSAYMLYNEYYNGSQRL